MSEKKTKSVVLPEHGFVRQDVIRELLGGISKGALHEAVRSGDFPEPIRVTAKTIAWDVDEVRLFIERQKAQAKAQRKKRMEKMHKTDPFYEGETEPTAPAPQP